MHRSRRTPIVALLLAAGLLIAACGGGGGSKAEFCGKAGDLKNLGGSFRNASGLSEIKTAFAKANSKIEQADSAAPSDIKKDVDTIKKAFGQVNTEVQKTNSEQDLSKLGSKFSGLTNSGTVKAAGDRVSSYAKKNCNVDLSS